MTVFNCVEDISEATTSTAASCSAFISGLAKNDERSALPMFLFSSNVAKNARNAWVARCFPQKKSEFSYMKKFVRIQQIMLAVYHVMNFLLQSKLPPMILINFSLLSFSLQFHCLAMMQLTPASDRIAADWNGHSKVNSLQLHCKESIYQ